MDPTNCSNGAVQSKADALRALDRYFDAVQADILSRQDPATGLLPASTAVTVHGDYRHAWVRDNVYSVLAVWGLALAYRRHGGQPERGQRLEQSTVKLMRGLLHAMMKQADRVERFKHTQNPLDALHAKYDTRSGDAVVGDGDWGHLQIDATGLFVLMLAQMTESGLRLIRDSKEAAFLQNLVYYLGAAWHTPDYGIWERGHKRNEGVRELNASSVGMAKAALEAMQGFNPFGPDAGHESIIHVVPDDVARARIALQSLLPRESTSKEIDAALLSVIGFPAYAVEDPALVARTRTEIVDKLQGPYGCKRFLRDGHQTAVEDHARLHYAEGELRLFQGIESEWPLFFTYLLLDGSLRGDQTQASDYRARLDRLAVTRDGRSLLPELYYVPSEHVEWEKLKPGSQPREANENLPLVWAQSLYMLGCLVEDGLIQPSDIDPLGRRQRIGELPGSRVRVALQADDEATLRRLTAAGLSAEGPGANSSITFLDRETLAAGLENVGACPALGLTGRPPRPSVDPLFVTQVFTALDGGLRVVVTDLPGPRESRLGADPGVRLAGLRGWISHLSEHWAQPGEPLVVLRLGSDLFAGADGQAFLEGLTVLLQDGMASNSIHCDGLSALVDGLPRVRLDAINGELGRPLLPPSDSRPQPAPFATDRVAGHEIADAVSQIVVHQHRLALGRTLDPGSVVDAPLPGEVVADLVRRFGDSDPVLQQLVLEIIVLLGTLLRADPSRFAGVLTLRPWHLLDLMAEAVAQENGVAGQIGVRQIGAARLSTVSAGELLARLDQVVRAATHSAPSLLHEPLPSTGDSLQRVTFRTSYDPQHPQGGWLAWRRHKGVVGGLPDTLSPRVWEILRRSQGLVIGGAFENSNRLDSEAVRADMSIAERDFSLRLESLLAGIQAPEYRQICIEALEALGAIAVANPGLHLGGDVNLDALIEHAVRRYWESHASSGAVLEHGRADAWLAFESSPPHEVANAIMKALEDVAAEKPPGPG